VRHKEQHAFISLCNSGINANAVQFEISV